jgi:hypothetical protein
VQCVIFFAHAQQKKKVFVEQKNRENRKNDKGQPPEIRQSKEGMTFFISMSAAAKI